MTTALSVATLPVIRAMLDDATRKKYSSGVLGVRARPEPPRPAEFTHSGTPVRVVPCESALAVWEAITERDPAQWLVVLTDREDDDLGAGIRAHLLWNRLRTPDPWEAVRQRFAASALDVSLTAREFHREVATGLLAATPAGGWPPAPGGVLTRDHAMSSVVQDRLAFPETVVDLASVLLWTTDPDQPVLIGNLRDDAGSALADAVLDWVADRCAAVAPVIRHLLRTGTGRDAVPLGLVAGVLARAADGDDAGRSRIGREGLIRLEPSIGAAGVPSSVLAVWSAECESTMLGLHLDPARQRIAESLLRRADELLAVTHGEGVADESDWLRAGLNRRLAALADALRREFAHRAGQQAGRPDATWLSATDLSSIEEAWSRVAAHRLATRDDHRVGPFHAAVRLARYLAVDTAVAAPAAVTGELAELTSRHVRQDAWADSALNDAAAGVSDAALGAGLSAVVTAESSRRSAHDAAFARALAWYTAQHSGKSVLGDVWHIEDVIRDVVFPIADNAPVLLLVLDGMAVSNAVEIIGSVLDRASEGWTEVLLPGAAGRAAALAVLPTLTEASRASLLTGRLITGGQDIERAGYDELCRSHKISTAPLAHKASLDTSQAGEALSADLSAAIGDSSRVKLVTCVLNTIDDALDRSDPGGTEWTDTAVRHLRPLLEQARRAGRVVVMTADHGHVIERRQGTQRYYPDVTSNRSRSAQPSGADGEMLFTGERVLLPVPGGPAILAVDERIRFGPLKAGYHGGASPAEVIVPVAVLVDGALPEGTALRLAPLQEPAWWADPLSRPAAAQPGETRPARQIISPAVDARLRSASGAPPTLFDEPEAGRPEPSSADAESGTDAFASRPGGRTDTAAAGGLAGKVTGSAAYAAQRKISGRISVTDDKVADLLAALLGAPDFRIGPAQAALALGVPQIALRGAVLHVQRLLNIEGYPVVRVDDDGATVILDEPLLREQFGIRI